jgi:hypothetical protein
LGAGFLHAEIRTSCIAGLKISSLRRRNRCEQCSVRLEIEEVRRVIDGGSQSRCSGRSTATTLCALAK